MIRSNVFLIIFITLFTTTNYLYSQNSTPDTTLPDISGMSYQEAYSRALDYYNAYDYEKARKLFRALVKRDPTHPLTDNCQFWIGECYYGEKRFALALKEFQEVFKYPDGNKYPSAQFKIGMCYRYLGLRQQEVDAFQKFIDFFPSDANVKKAKEFINREYRKRKATPNPNSNNKQK